MIERPTNDETYGKLRGQVLDQLKERFRRARSECPMVGPEDIAILRNVVRPAMDQNKIGSAGREYLLHGPLLPLLLKEAGLWDDIKSNAGQGWDYLKDQVGEAGQSFVDAGKNLIGQGETGSWWDSSKPWYANLAGDVGKVFDTISAPGKAIYNLGQGVVGGGLATASPDALEAVRTSDVGKGVDRAAEWLAGDAATVAATGGGSLLARLGMKAVPKFLGRMGVDVAAGTAIPGVVSKLQGGDFASGAQLPWSDKPLFGGGAEAPQPEAEAPVAPAPQTLSMSGLYNPSYWGGGPTSLSGLQGFSGEIENRLRGIIPGMPM